MGFSSLRSMNIDELEGNLLKQVTCFYAGRQVPSDVHFLLSAGDALCAESRLMASDVTQL